MAELTDSLRSRVEADFALMTGGGTEAAHDAVVRSFGSDALNLYKSVDLAPGAPRIGLAAWIDFAERFAGLNGTTGLESLMTRVERSCSGAFVSKREPMDASWPVLEVDEENKQHSLVHLIAAVARKLAGLKAVSSWDGSSEALDEIKARAALGDQILGSMEDHDGDETLETAIGAMFESGLDAAFVLSDLAEWVAELQDKASAV